MRQTRTAVLFALLTAALLAVGGGRTAAPAEGHTSLASRISALAARIAPALTARAAAPLRAEGRSLTFRGSEGPASNLRLSAEGTSLRTVYEAGTGLAALAGETRAHALASADFDEDGTPDLVGGYEAGGGGVVTIQHGNVDAVYPHSPEARERRMQGRFNGSPFHEAAAAFALPEAAHFVGAGDFDADGHFDVAAGRRGGGTLYLLRGDGRGNLSEPEPVGLPGGLTAFATGEVNRPDGLADIVVGVAGEVAAAALVFESPTGALRGRPETLTLTAAPSGLALGALDDDSSRDLVVAAGDGLVVFHGRDRRLTLDEQARAGVPEARVSRSSFEYALAGVAVGDFVGDERADVAVLSADGAVQVLARSGSDADAAPVAGAVEADDARAARVADEARGASAWRGVESVRIAEWGPGGAQSFLSAAKVSGFSKDDLLVLGGGRARVITNNGASVKAGGKVKRGAAQNIVGETDLRVAASLDGEGGLAAVLPMRLSPSALNSLVAVGADSKTPSVATQAAAVVFTVNTAASTPDANPGNGECKDSDDNCSLPAVVSEIANSSVPGPFTVNFQIPGAGVPVINTTDLIFNKPVIIDGTTQPAGRVEVRGAGRSLLIIRGGNSTVRGLVLSGNENAILMQTAGNNIIEGNYLGTNAEGTAEAAARNSLNVYVQSPNNRIGGTTPAARNVISGANIGVDITAAAGNVVQGNYIGTDASGTSSVGNRNGIITRFSDAVIGGTAPGSGNLISGNGAGGGNAVYLHSDSASAASSVQGNRIGTNASGDAALPNTGVALWMTLSAGSATVGGTTPAARNVISGNAGRGLYVTSASAQPSYVQGNYIGTSADGTTALPNSGGGVHLDRAGITLGGTVTGAGNLISGNGGDGVYVGGAFGSPNHRIQGNLIGTDVSGTLALANQGDGVEAFRADNVLIGGTTPEARNVISANRENGLNLSGTDGRAASPLRVEGNYVGVNRFGTGPLGNGRHGVLTSGNTESNNIGGTAPGAGNLIAHNAESGVASDRPLLTGPVLSNSIHSNGELGIDVNDDGVTPISNESNSNRPELLNATNNADGTVVTGRVYNYGSLEPYTIQFFSNTSCDPSGFGEGRTPVGQVSVPAPTRYTYVNFSATLSPAVAGGAVITAVNVRAANQSDPDPNILHTSEFSNCLQLAAPTPTPTPTPTPGASPTPTPSATPTPSPSPSPTPVPLQVFVIAPARGGDAAAVTRQITGQGFLPGVTARLTRPGQPDVVGTGASVTNEGTTLTATFDLAGRARGLWSVVVTNPGGESATLPDAFTIEEARPSNVWVDFVGRFTMRSGRVQRFHLAYGNTGDVDGPATIVQLFIPMGITIEELPPPAEGRGVSVVNLGGSRVLQLYVERLPANTTFFVPLRLGTPPEFAHSNVEFKATALSADSLNEEFTPPPSDPTIAVAADILVDEPDRFKVNARLTNGAGQAADYEFDYTVAGAEAPEELQYSEINRGDTIQYELSVTTAEDQTTSGSPALFASRAGGVQSQKRSPYTKHRLVLVSPIDVNDIFQRLSEFRPVRMRDSLEKRLTRCLASEGILEESMLDEYTEIERADVLAQKLGLLTEYVKRLRNWTGPAAQEPASKLFNMLDDRWAVQVPDLVAHDFVDGKNSHSRSALADEAREYVRSRRLNPDGSNAKRENEILWHIYEWILYHCKCKVFREIAGGSSLEVPAPRLTQAESLAGGVNAEGCGCTACDRDDKIIIREVIYSEDPNDKVGSQGVGTQRFINRVAPMPYTVFFENKPAATAPAQDVFITDQLDTTKFDLSTFQLGPVSFGTRVVTPPPGLSRWTTDVDLRPANNLIVRIDAGLNFQTGVVRWAFTSLDPATIQPTEDPLAGFLPPNRTSPEGEGSVLFTVTPKESLAAGDELRNAARIVFDANPHIDTPVWLNTVDSSPPASKVSALAAAQPYIVFDVSWSGSDAGSGLRDYTVFVSEGGGPYTEWLTDTTVTSGIFVGAPGKTYSFYTVARDLAGNVEAVETTPDAATATPGVVTNSIDDARFFVLQHYRDFLGRDPDPSGFDFWTDEIAKCGPDLQCREVKRIHVSAAFFLSIEFQETGFLAYRARKAAFGNIPGNTVPVTRAELLSDARLLSDGVVVGAEDWQPRLEQNKQAYFNQLAASERFTSLYPQSMTPEAFVDALNSNAGGALSQAERDTLVANLKGNAKTRPQALRAVAEDIDLSKAEFNKAFVLMQYFGYLRRNPDDTPDSDFSGFNFWLAKLDSYNGNFIQAELVKAFISSDEYRKRFGQ